MILLMPIIFTLAFVALVVWLVPKLDPPAVRAARRRGGGIRFWNGPFHIGNKAWRDPAARKISTAEAGLVRLMKRRYEMIADDRRRRND